MTCKLKLVFFLLIIPFLFGCSNNTQETNSIETPEQQYINLIHNFYGNGRIYCSNDSLNQTGAIFIDFDTLESVPLCARPNCNHNNSECTAKIVGTNSVIYNDYIYYFTSIQGVNELENGKREFYINSKLSCVSNI